MYNIYKETALSGAAEVITVQQPATGGKCVQFKTLTLYALAAATFTLERDGTGATTTALTVIAKGGAPTPAFTAFNSSNVGSGTVLEAFTLVAGQTMVVDLAGYRLCGDGIGKNFTVRTNSLSTTVRICIKADEIPL